MRSIEKEAADLANLLEAAARGLLRRRHKKHVKSARSRIEKVLRGYFKRQGEALVKELGPRLRVELAALPPKLVEASSNGRNFANHVLPASVAPLRYAVIDSEVTEYNDAITRAIEGAAATFSKEVGSTLAAPEDFASRYLRDNSLSKLTGDFNETSVDQLRTAIANAWDKGGSYDQIVAAVKDTFSDFSDVRAGMIAQTEAVDAYNEGRSQTARAAGFDEKSWETESGDPCPVCIDNEEDGWIDIDDNFSSGDSEPTAHPNCQCVLNYRKGDEED